MRGVLLFTVVALGGFGYFVMSPGKPPVPPSVSKAASPNANRSLITALKRQIEEEEETLRRSVYNRHTTVGDVTKGTSEDSIENRARRARIQQLRNRLAALE
jgi:hypothetical protein